MSTKCDCYTEVDMRRILIDNTVKSYAEAYADEMTGKTHSMIHWHSNAMPQRLLSSFYKHLDSKGYGCQAHYVSMICVMYRSLLTLQPKRFEEIHNQFFLDWDDDDLNLIIEYKGKKQEFYKHVIDCMRYKDIRSNLMRYFIHEQHIKACVYCNAQYAVTTDRFKDADGKWKRIGTYQFDHFYPESKYPYLCTSFFNLHPSCPTCNDIKLQRMSLFNLYTDDAAKQDVFVFVLDSDKQIEDYMKDDMDRLAVMLQSNDKRLLINHNRLFHINEIYSQHTDVLQRLVVTIKNNRPEYRQSLQDSLSELFPNGVEDPQYFFFGYYMKSGHIHRQPLAKMVQDVVKQLGG